MWMRVKPDLAGKTKCDLTFSWNGRHRQRSQDICSEVLNVQVSIATPRGARIRDNS